MCIISCKGSAKFLTLDKKTSFHCSRLIGILHYLCNFNQWEINQL